LLLLERDAPEFDGKTFITRGDPTSREKSVARVVEPAELGQGAAVVVVDVGVVCGWAMVSIFRWRAWVEATVAPGVLPG
jgi:hypothetical protein